MYNRRLIPLNNSSVTAWCDSQVTLAWLSQYPSKWKTFVANRISFIQTELPSVKWRHVASPKNTADLATRGLEPEALQENYLWWNGPQWLSLPPVNWPPQFYGSETDSEEFRSFFAVKSEADDEILSGFSSL